MVRKISDSKKAKSSRQNQNNKLAPDKADTSKNVRKFDIKNYQPMFKQIVESTNIKFDCYDKGQKISYKIKNRNVISLKTNGDVLFNRADEQSDIEGSTLCKDHGTYVCLKIINANIKQVILDYLNKHKQDIIDELNTDAEHQNPAPDEEEHPTENINRTKR